MANTTSGTTTFDKTFAIEEIIEDAFERIGLNSVAGYQLKSARRSLNILFQEWGNRGIHYCEIADLNIDLNQIIADMKKKGMKVSLFIDPNIDMVDFSLDHGADRVELYTGDYAKNYLNNKFDSVINYKKTADYAILNDLEVNAGHDLDLINLEFLKSSIPELYEVSIGHALICNSLYYGLEQTIKMYLDKLK